MIDHQILGNQHKLYRLDADLIRVLVRQLFAVSDKVIGQASHQPPGKGQLPVVLVNLIAVIEGLQMLNGISFQDFFCAILPADHQAISP